jgi:threonine aldolase
MTPSRHIVFASDNWSGLCPEALDALLRANAGSVAPYGADGVTDAVRQQIQGVFECEAEIYFVVSGTAANALALAQITAPYESILCHRIAHILDDECGAPSFFSHGAGIRPISQRDDGCMALDDLEKVLSLPSDLRFQPPRVLSLTQTTERGTVYKPEALKALIGLARSKGLRIHMDGARFFQACAALGLPPKDLSWELGVDVLTLGISKLGGGLSDAILFFDHGLAEGFDHRLKQAGHVPAKFRVLTAPWLGLLESDLWHSYALHANAMMEDLESRLKGLGLHPVYTREANMAFFKFKDEEVARLREKGWAFHANPETGISRLVCGWDASLENNEAFQSDLAVIQESMA